jgi:hypothetical protein
MLKIGMGCILCHAEAFRVLKRVTVLTLAAIVIIVLNAIQKTAQHIRSLNKARKKPRLMARTLLVGTALVKFAAGDGQISKQNSASVILQHNSKSTCPPVDVGIHSFTLDKFKSQKIAQASLIPWVHNHEHTIADVGTITSGLVIAELFDRNAILADNIKQSVKISSGVVLWVQF